MSYIISKDFTFAASHQLNGLPDTHKCARLHGHNYVVRIELTGALDEVGFVLDYGELGVIGMLLDDLDHRHLNDLFSFNPTAELLAEWLWREAVRYLPAGSWRVSGVGVSETPKTWAWYRP